MRVSCWVSPHAHVKGGVRSPARTGRFGESTGCRRRIYGRNRRSNVRMVLGSSPPDGSQDGGLVRSGFVSEPEKEDEDEDDSVRGFKPVSNLLLRLVILGMIGLFYQLIFSQRMGISDSLVPVGDGHFGTDDVIFLSAYLLLLRPMLRIFYLFVKRLGLGKKNYAETFSAAVEPPLFWLGVLFAWLGLLDWTKTFLCTATSSGVICNLLPWQLKNISFAAYLVVLVNFLKTLFFGKVKVKNMNRRRRAEYALVDKAFTSLTVLMLLGFIAFQIGVSFSTIVAYGGFSTLFIGLAAQSFLKDMAAGFMIFLFQPFVTGDNIKLPNYEKGGQLKVIDIGWIFTELKQWDSSPVVVPNSALFGNKVINRTLKKFAYVSEVVHIRYADLPRIEGLLDSMRDYLRSRPEVQGGENGPIVVVEKLDSSYVDVRLMIWLINVPTRRRLHIVSTLWIGLAQTIRESGCEFAFPKLEITAEFGDQQENQLIQNSEDLRDSFQSRFSSSNGRAPT